MTKDPIKKKLLKLRARFNADELINWAHDAVDVIDDILEHWDDSRRLSPFRRIYYAHPVTLYDSPIEQADIHTLTALGWQVINPNEPQHELAYRARGMDYFTDLVKACNALAFRGFAAGEIPAGIHREIEAAQVMDLPIIELPSSIRRRVLNVDMTRAYLHESGRKSWPR